MWINKNVYLYEKKLAADRIAELEKQVEILQIELNAEKLLDPRLSENQAIKETPLRKQRDDNIDLRSARSREMAALQQTSMNSPFGGLQRKPIGQFFG